MEANHADPGISEKGRLRRFYLRNMLHHCCDGLRRAKQFTQLSSSFHISCTWKIVLLRRRFNNTVDSISGTRKAEIRSEPHPGP